MRREPVVAITVGSDLLDRLIGRLRVNRVELIAHTQNVSRFDLEVGRLTFKHATDERLVHEILRVRQRIPLALRAGAGDDRAHARRASDDVGRDIAGDEVHRVDDAETRGDAATWAVDVERDIGARIFVGEEEQLRDDEVRHLVVDWPAEEDDAVVEEPRVDVVGALAAAGLLNDDGDQGHGVSSRKEVFQRERWVIFACFAAFRVTCCLWIWRRGRVWRTTSWM